MVAFSVIHHGSHYAGNFSGCCRINLSHKESPMKINKDELARLVLTVAYTQSLAEQLGAELGKIKEQLAKIMLEERV